MNEKKFIVTNSPWPSALPNGTPIKRCEPRANKEGDWFQRVDEKSLDPENEPDNKFKLFTSEFEEVK